MKRYISFCLLIVMMVCLCGCHSTSSTADIQTTDIGDTRMLLVDVEGEMTDGLSLRVVRVEKNGKDGYVETDLTDLVPMGDASYGAVLPQSGVYLLEVRRNDGETTYRVIRFKNSQIVHMHVNVDDKTYSDDGTFWPYTPHNTPDVAS